MLMLHDCCLENICISHKTMKYTANVSTWFMHISLPRFGRVCGYMRYVLHWLPYPQCIVYRRISALVRPCIEEHRAPSYLRELVAPLLLFSVVSHCTPSAQAELLVPERGLLSDSAEPSLWMVRRLGMVSWLRCVLLQWPTLLYFDLVLRPHCLTKVGLGALLSRLP